MSGGHFDYQEFRLEEIGSEIKKICTDKEYEFSKETWKEFNRASALLSTASIYIHRIDYLLCGDDGEDTFHERLANDLKYRPKPETENYVTLNADQLTEWGPYWNRLRDGDEWSLVMVLRDAEKPYVMRSVFSKMCMPLVGQYRGPIKAPEKD